MLALRRAIQPRRYFSRTTAVRDDDHKEESYEEYTASYCEFFKHKADDVFELQRGLNNAFSTDIVPAPSVIVEALRACRKLNSFTLAVRTLEGLRDKIQDEKLYGDYVEELQPIIKELGISTPEELSR